MQRFVGKLFLFLSIPTLCLLSVAAALPINVFNFRSWEALRPSYLPFSGVFYPNHELNMIEVGDLGVRTPYAVERPVSFVTDRFGYRHRSRDGERFDGIVIGDSFTAGSGLTQDDTLTEMLVAEHDLHFYPLAPLQTEPFDYPNAINVMGGTDPEILIYEIAERTLDGRLSRLNCTQDTVPIPPQTSTLGSKGRNDPDMNYATIDRMLRHFLYFRNYVIAQMTEPQVPIVSTRGMLFYEPAVAPQTNLDMIADYAERLAGCSQWFARREVRFVFMPIPDKEWLYFDEIPADVRGALTVEARRAFLVQVIAASRARGVETIDLTTDYLAARASGVEVYQLDDTHWSPEGVRIAARSIAALLEGES